MQNQYLDASVPEIHMEVQDDFIQRVDSIRHTAETVDSILPHAKYMITFLKESYMNNTCLVEII